MPAGRISTLNFVQGVLPKTDLVGPLDFWSLKKHSIPVRPGAYVLVANVQFQYPTGKSPVFYIGQSDDLRQRLTDHLKYSTHVAENKRAGSPLYFPRYEYAGRFAKWYAYLRTWQRLRPEVLEQELMGSFAQQYGTFPVANGVGCWDRLHKYLDRL